MKKKIVILAAFGLVVINFFVSQGNTSEVARPARRSPRLAEAFGEAQVGAGGRDSSDGEGIGEVKYSTRAPATANLFSRQTNRILPEPQASLLNGILWGEQKQMPKDFYEGLRRTGTLHVIALSGMNITILINLIASLTLFLGRPKSVLISLILIVIFILFVGASASVVRAGIMGSLSLLAVYFGRKSWASLSLILAAGIMLIFNPSWLWQIGFQLSFLATLGIILFTGQTKLRRGRGWVSEVVYEGKVNLRTTLAAQVFTLPIILYNFKQLSLVAPLTNVLVLWIVQPTMVLGLGLSVMSYLFFPLAYPLAWIVWLPLTYFIEVVKITARIPLASISF